jgi:hypothetical protein
MSYATMTGSTEAPDFVPARSLTYVKELRSSRGRVEKTRANRRLYIG